MKHILLALGIFAPTVLAATEGAPAPVPIISAKCIDCVTSSELTAEQMVASIKQCGREVAKTPDPVKTATDVITVAPEILQQAGTVAVTVSQTVKMVAKELNVAVNEFVTTPVGMLTAGLVAMHFGGEYAERFLNFLWNVVIGIIIMVVGLWFGSSFRRKLLTSSPVQTTMKGIFGREYIKTTTTVMNIFDALEGLSKDASEALMTTYIISYVVQGFAIIFGIGYMV